MPPTVPVDRYPTPGNRRRRGPGPVPLSRAGVFDGGWAPPAL